MQWSKAALKREKEDKTRKMKIFRKADGSTGRPRFLPQNFVGIFCNYKRAANVLYNYRSFEASLKSYNKNIGSMEK